MKKVCLFIALIFLLSATKSEDPCNTDALSSDCIGRLAEGFNFLKTYKIDGQDGARDHVEYSYVFTKGTQYMISVCPADQGASGIIVSLFDSKRNKVASSKVDNQVVSAIAYPCNATGIYYIQYTFASPAASCGGSAMGFKR